MTQIVGRRLGRYEVQQEIGRGGMARVYRALDTLLQRPVAIKVMAPQLGLDPEFTHRFEREAIMAANLHHPAIITVYDVGDQDGLNYIAMEYIRGRTLHAILSERGALGLGYAVRLLEPVARALDYAHSQGAVHRDVKPHNIMVDVDGRVLLTDFGIAQLPESETTERLTRTGVFMGTPEYISPEQAQARRVDGRSDLYSLGIVGYEIITGRVPFSGATPNLLVAHTQTPPPPVTSIVADLPRDIDTALARALAKNPQARFATGTAMVEALRLVARRNGIALATSAQLAALASPLNSKDDQKDGVPPDVPAPPRQPAVSRVEPPLGADTLVAPPNRQPATRPKPVQSSSPAARGDRRSQTQRLLTIVAWVLAAALLVLVLFTFSRNANSDNGSPVIPSAALPATSRQPSSNGLGVIATLAASPTTEASIAPTLAPSSTTVPSPSLAAESPTVAVTFTVAPAPSDTSATLPAASATITPTVRLTATRSRPRPSSTPTTQPTNTPAPPTVAPEPPSNTPEAPTTAPIPPTATPEPPTTPPEPTTEPTDPADTLPTVRVIPSSAGG